MTRSRVLIVDDSSLMRRLLHDILSADAELDVVGAAPDPLRAWDLIQRTRPDVLTLDVEMPRMDGLVFLEKLMRARPMPVVMVSSLTEAGCKTTLRALELGAVDFVSKPKIDIARGLAEIGEELTRKVKAAARARVQQRPGPPSVTAVDAPRDRTYRPLAGSTVVLALGASTGGTEALRTILQQLPADAPGVVIVQHMPQHFTQKFAERLDKHCAIRVREAADGDRILRGHALIAPGGSLHSRLERRGTDAVVRLVAGVPVNHSRPSVDVLFHSCAEVLGPNAVGAILTGMGNDGAEGLFAMRSAGARTVAQDEASCVVFGMPKEAIARGAVQVVAPVQRIATILLELASSRN